ncbi:hypothetical protein Saso_14680 [Streptomyces asoensis]|uniref:Transposase n=1 Tax=Streptomyces asoensis TaxID=249586 RepID=A0ABQ3RVE3_9ACTN|nr:hypothetical protein GCM10010496_67730 [Streptomyces asoensis]GHI59818.1 hypothetical protein Saso_14680 [Streptomyces asoensis]
MQDGVTEQGEGPDAPVGARDGAVSHGGKGTVLSDTRMPLTGVRWCRDSGVRMDLDRLTTYHVAVRQRRGAYARRIEN